MSAPTVFGAVCARCNHDFDTGVWPPAYDLCPECRLGVATIISNERKLPRDLIGPRTLPIRAAWGAGS